MKRIKLNQKINPTQKSFLSPKSRLFVKFINLNLSEINEVKILSLSLKKANLEAYISIRKESDLLRLMQSYRIEIKANSDMDNKYEVRRLSLIHISSPRDRG